MSVARLVLVLCFCFLLGFFVGCATPASSQLSHTRVLAPDQEDDMGGSFIESADIRTVASRMCPAILAVPEVADNPDVTRIAVDPIRNSTRYVFDKNIFMKRLRIELNRFGSGRVRFIDPKAARGTTMRVVKERDEEAWDDIVNEAADYVVGSQLVQTSSEPIRMAVLPVKNTNLVDMNADSFTAFLRARISEKSYGKVRFITSTRRPKEGEEPLDPAAEFPNADYYLSGEFFAKSVKGEKLLLVKGVYYIASDGAARRDSSVNVNVNVTSTVSGPGDAEREQPPDTNVTSTSTQTANLTPLIEMKRSPNVTKYLNVIVIDSKTREAVLEKLVKVEKKVTSGLGRADLVLTGEISALSKASGGDRSDYVIMSFQLIEPETNEVVWEDAYETKKVTSTSVLYK